MRFDVKEYKIEDACELITGFPFQSKYYLEKGKYKVIRGDNVKEGNVYWKEKTRCWNELSTKLEKYILKENDIVIGMDGSKVGKNRAVIKKEDLPALLAQRVACVRANGQFDQNYIWYILHSNTFENYVDSIKTGTSIPHISLKQISEFRFKAPSIKEQNIISNILLTLDKKIELNNKINNILQTMAQLLFKHWFINFEFPNEDGQPYKSSGGEMIDSELGMIPKDWEVKNITEMVDSISIKHRFNKNKVIFLNTSDIFDGEVLIREYADVETLPGQAKKSIQQDDILYSEIRPQNRRFAYIDFQAEDYVVSTKLMVLRAKEGVCSPIIYFKLIDNNVINELQVIAESRSGTFPQITFNNLKEIKLAVPCERMDKYGEAFKLILNKISQAKNQNRHLRAMRDTILPKLMNGEIDLENIEI